VAVAACDARREALYPRQPLLGGLGMLPELHTQRGVLHVDPRMSQNKLRHEDRRPFEVWRDRLELAQPAPGVEHHPAPAVWFLHLDQRRQVCVARDKYVYLLSSLSGRGH
jgi:hypothetical protein